MELVVRTFVEVKNVMEAEKAAATLVDGLRSLGLLTTIQAKPYWKIPEYFEILIVVDLQVESTQAILVTQDLIGGDWSSLGNNESILTNEEIGPSSSPELRWAHIEAMESAVSKSVRPSKHGQ
jgi:hypothetical protein